MRALLRTALSLIAVCALGAVSPVQACLARPFTFKDLFAAEVIVRATAVRRVAPAAPSSDIMAAAYSGVEFKVEEVLRGADVPAGIALAGSLVDFDDLNETPVPYKLVRKGGRGGSCYAHTYKQGAQFLLFLKKTAGGYTSDISPLGPTNEQLRSETDPWLLWVKARLNPCGKLHEGDVFYERMRRGEIWEHYETIQGQKFPSFKYRAAKCYLQKYEAKDGPADQYITYIKKWVEAYERLEEQR